MSLDAGFLGTRDRAALRILNRAVVATTAQLVTLVYHRRQTAQEHLSALYRAGWLERAVLPPDTRGGAPLAFRLSPRARRRLGYGPLTRSRAGTQLRHSLNIVETVAALTRLAVDPADRYPVQAWLTESIVTDANLPHVYPDSVVTLQLAGGSGVLCLEHSRATRASPGGPGRSSSLISTPRVSTHRSSRSRPLADEPGSDRSSGTRSRVGA